MSAASSFRAITPARLAIIFVLLVALFWTRDLWLPSHLPYSTAVSSKPSKAQQTPESTYDVDDDSQHASSPASAHSPARSSAGSPFTAATSPPTAHHSSSFAAAEDCLNAPGADKVLVMLKTGATELYQKLPTHFQTTFRCVPNFLIFSDLDQYFGDTHVLDAIAPVSKKWRDEHEDFELYRKIEEWQKEGQDLGKLKGDGGWNLDKWKFMPMLHQAFESAPEDIEWFVMIEADTSLSWNNLLLFLKTMNPKKPYYLGAQNWIGDTTFAHGGSGIIMSRAAADKLEKYRHKMGVTRYDEQWEEVTSTSCCGDEIVARAFMEVDIPLTASWPLIQGEALHTVDFTDQHWCAPPITWHHVSPIDVDTMYQFQMSWIHAHGWQTPYLYRDVFEHFIDRHVAVNRSSWNNISKDTRYAAPDVRDDEDLVWEELDPWEQESVATAGACAAACREINDCIQWMHTTGRCQLGRAIRFGSSDEQDDVHWTSGWMYDRVEAFKKEMQGCKIRWEG